MASHTVCPVRFSQAMSIVSSKPSAIWIQALYMLTQGRRERKFICRLVEQKELATATVNQVCKPWMYLRSGKQCTLISAANCSGHKLMWSSQLHVVTFAAVT